MMAITKRTNERETFLIYFLPVFFQDMSFRGICPSIYFADHDVSQKPWKSSKSWSSLGSHIWILEHTSGIKMLVSKWSALHFRHGEGRDKQDLSNQMACNAGVFLRDHAVTWTRRKKGWEKEKDNLRSRWFLHSTFSNSEMSARQTNQIIQRSPINWAFS